MYAKLLQSCPTLCNTMDCSPPGSSVHGTLQARILEWVAMPSSRGSSWPRDRTHMPYVPCIGRWASLVAQTVKNPSAMGETWVWSLGWEDPLEKWMATHSRILAWEFHGQRSLVAYSQWGCKELDMTEWLTLSLSHVPEGCAQEGASASLFLQEVEFSEGQLWLKRLLK